VRYYLGIGGSKHDYATCLVADGRVLVAIEEERLTRKKRGFGIPEDRRLAGIGYCLDAAGIRLADVDAVLVNDLLEPWCYEDLRKDVNIVGHHLTHAASAYYFSGFDRAAVLVADHSGGRWRAAGGGLVTEVVSHYRGDGDDLDLVDRVSCADVAPENAPPQRFSADLRGSAGTDLLKKPRHSLGRFYARLSRAAGCTSLMGDGQRHTESGKLMGLSAHGGPEFLPLLRECYRLRPGGVVEFGTNDAGEDFEALARRWLAAGDGTGSFDRRAAVAFATQRCLEEMVLHCARHTADLTGEADLVLAGGIFLNGLANNAMLADGRFTRLFVQPAAHDAGTALGAAVLGAVRDGTWRRGATFSPLLGIRYPEHDVAAALRSAGVPHRKLADPEAVAARAIAGGLVVGRFTGRSEFGPRALGNRSILADPRDPEVRRTLDERIKYREPYRPYAPAVRAADSADWFTLAGPSPHMLLIGRATARAERAVPAVVHADRTVRAQDVEPAENPSLHRLLDEFAGLTGVPLVLNTSMNVQGEPIVESPEDAIAFLYSCLVDAMFIEGFVATRSARALDDVVAKYGADARS
jgi:carbamoyltransferase